VGRGRIVGLISFSSATVLGMLFDFATRAAFVFVDCLA